MSRVVLAVALIGVMLSPVCACFSHAPATRSGCCAAITGSEASLAAPSCCHVDAVPQPALASMANQTYSPSLPVLSYTSEWNGAIPGTPWFAAEAVSFAPSPPAAISVLRI